jgi:hypothetical protein
MICLVTVNKSTQSSWWWLEKEAQPILTLFFSTAEPKPSKFYVLCLSLYLARIFWYL